MANETETATHATDAAAGAAHSAPVETVGMPQLDITTFSNQIFWLAVTLVVLYFLFSRVALPRISAILAARAGTISGDLAAAEELKKQAEAAEKAYAQALADARAEAAKIVSKAKAEMQAEVDAATAKANEQIADKAQSGKAKIAEIRAGAVAAVGEVARDTAAAVIAALGGKADAAGVSAAVSEQMKG